MNQKVSIRLLATGVPGLDAILGGGLPEFSFNLIAGPPGSGKTILAHQIMFALATLEGPALYFTVLGEPPLKMLRYQQQFSYFDPERVNASIRFFNLSEEVAAGDLSKVLERITREVAACSPALVFVDSFRSVMLEARQRPAASMGLQQFIQQLGMALTGCQATTFLIGEYVADSGTHPVFTVADGLLSLDQSVHRNSMVRKMQVLKMRGQATSPGVHTFRISNAGIEVFPSAVVHDDGDAAQPARAAPRSTSAPGDGRAAPGRHARRRPALGLFAADRGAVRVGQDHRRHRFPGRGRAARRTGRDGGVRADPEPVMGPQHRRPGARRENRPDDRRQQRRPPGGRTSLVDGRARPVGKPLRDALAVRRHAAIHVRAEARRAGRGDLQRATRARDDRRDRHRGGRGSPRASATEGGADARRRRHGARRQRSKRLAASRRHRSFPRRDGAGAGAAHSHGHSLDLRGAWLHLLGDTLGALAALCAALVIRFGGHPTAIRLRASSSRRSWSSGRSGGCATRPSCCWRPLRCTFRSPQFAGSSPTIQASSPYTICTSGRSARATTRSPCTFAAIRTTSSSGIVSPSRFEMPWASST